MKTKEKVGNGGDRSDLCNHLIAGGNQKAYDVFDYATTTIEKQEICAMCNPSTKNQSVIKLCAGHRAETDALAKAIFGHLVKPRKVVKLQKCAGCGKCLTAAKFSLYHAVCKKCLSGAREKSKLGRSNFIERTLNNLRKNLRGALANA